MSFATMKYVLHLRRQDMRRNFVFRLARTEARMRNDYMRCRSASDYFQFAATVFGLTQIESEILPFLEFVEQESPSVVCEIGTQTGGTSFLLGQIPSSVKCVIGIDLFVQNELRLRRFARRDQQLHAINGSSYAPRTLRRVKRLLAGKRLDVLFIDGDHSYDGVRRDFFRYRSLVREGGIIAFHDIIGDHASRFGTPTTAYVGDVPQFWAEIERLYPSCRFVHDSEQDGCGIGALRYSAAVKLPARLTVDLVDAGR